MKFDNMKLTNQWNSERKVRKDVLIITYTN